MFMLTLDQVKTSQTHTAQASSLFSFTFAGETSKRGQRWADFTASTSCVNLLFFFLDSTTGVK
jgi:hypothetical protein